MENYNTFKRAVCTFLVKLCNIYEKYIHQFKDCDTPYKIDLNNHKLYTKIFIQKERTNLTQNKELIITIYSIRKVSPVHS